MGNKKALKVFSTASVAGMIATAVLSSQAFAAVDAYSIKVGGDVYQYNKENLAKSFVEAKRGNDAVLYDDFIAKLEKAGGFFAFHDDKTGYVDFENIKGKFQEAKRAGQEFKVDEYTESKDAKVVEVPTVKKAVVKEGKVVYEEENSGKEGEVSIKAVTPLNLKQVKIEFAQKIEDTDVKDDIEDIDNYTLEDKDGDEVDDVMIKEVKLDESKKFAILTFNDKVDSKGKYLIENQEKYTLTIDEDVTGDEVKKEIVFKDTELPEVEKLEVVGVDTVKVTFSEPVMPYNIEKVSDSIGEKNVVAPELDDDDFEINDGDISINKVELVNNNKEANIIVGTNFKDGEDLKVRVKSSVKDYAGLTTISSPKKTTVKEDKKAPEVVGFKDIDTEDRGSKTYEKVTLIFDKDIKFKNMDDTEITNDSDLENYYHTSDKEGNRPEIVKVDGKELTLYFEDDTFANGTTNIYIKSGAIESRWEVENYKLSTRIEKEKDDTAPELTRVEQHEDYNNKIKIKFSEKVKTGDKTEDKSALKAKNYTLTDNKGKEWKIDKVEKDGTSEKEFIITTTKDLDEDLKYKLTVENVEDKAGNAIKKVTKEFTVKDNDAVDADDITIKVYSAGTSSQKIVVDFDTKMKMDSSRYSAKDLSKYTLVAKNKDGKGLGVFDDKSSINLSDMYKAEIKTAKDGKAVEITLPSKENKDDLKDKQYKLNDLGINNEEVKLYLQIDRVEDANGNVTTRNYELAITDFSGKGEIGSITFDDDEDYAPQVKSPEEIFFSFDDKVDFNIKDIKVVAAASEEDAKKAADKLVKAAEQGEDLDTVKLDTAKLLKIATHKKGDHDGNTTVTLTMHKSLKNDEYDDDDYNHIFTYDGKYLDKDGNKLDVYVFAVPSKIVNSNHVTSTKNDYDETLKLGSAGMIKVEDKLAPVVKDNDRIAKANRYGDDKENTDEIVEYYYNKADNTGAIVVTFEEDIDPASVSRSSVTLNKDDFEDGKVSSVKAVGNKVVINVEKLTDGDDKVEIERGHEIILKGVRDLEDNEAEELKLQVGDFKELTKEDVAKILGETVKPEINKTELNKTIAEANKKVEADYTPESYKALKDALAMPETNQAEVDAKTKAINEAIKGLDVKVEANQLVGEAKAFMGNEYAEIDLKDIKASDITKVTLDGADLAAEKYSVEGTTLSIIKANKDSKIQVVAGDKTYDVVFK